MVEIYGYSIATIPIVATVVYGIIELAKYLFSDRIEKIKKYIPLFAAFCGGIVTLLVFVVTPESVPCTSWYSAILMGCASGLSSVGVNQIKKQMTKGGADKNAS